MAAEAGHPLERETLVNAILAAFDARYRQLGTAVLRQAWARHLAMLGKKVKVIGPGETVFGALAGVTDEGAVIILLESGERRIMLAGDVHLREE
jgi:biotin-(acetyl-CoA carboxylase) ligase